MIRSFAVDVGGTFTDLVTLEPETGAVSFAKSPTTPSQPARGVLSVIRKSGLSLPDARVFLHGTTLGINSMLERKGARTGLITTRGFRDVLELRRLDWPMYQLFWRPPEPLVARHLRREVAERVLADGTERVALDEAEVRAAARYLAGRGVESIAVCFLHSYAHPEHERRAGEVIRDELGDVSITLSHEVTREYREYERTATTVADASIKRRMRHYIEDLERTLARESFDGSFVLTRCDGGVMGAAEAKSRPIRTLISGPASGAMGAVTLSRWLGEPNLIAADMGGTSFDASLVIDGEAALATATEVGGAPLLVPVVELATIGAGGGSIAWLDGGLALNVGPQSAGAEPGPVCYGGGGAEPTFTDAAVVSGLLHPARFLGGELALDLDGAREAIRSAIADPLGMTTEEAAAGIVSLAEANMAAMLEEITIEKGHDPRDFSLLAYGGGGSLVASALASRLEIPRVIVPPSPGTFSAWGMLTLDVVHDFAVTSLAAIDDLEPGDVRARFAQLDGEGAAALERERVSPERRALLRSMDLRYIGQEHVLTIPLPEAVLAAGELGALREVFVARHDQLYGYTLDEVVEVTAYRVRAVGSLEKPSRPALAAGGEDAGAARIGTRAARHSESGGELEWAVYDRARLQAGNRLHGPAIVEETAATTLVGPRQQLAVDTLGNLVISFVDQGR